MKDNSTRADILDAGVRIGRSGMTRVTLRAVGEAIAKKHTIILYYFADAAALRAAVVALGIERKDQEFIARLIVDDHPAVKKMDRADRRMYLATIQR